MIKDNQIADSSAKNVQVCIMVLVLLKNDYQELKHSLLFEYEDLFTSHFL